MFFSPVEKMIAWRYLRSRRREGFVSIITSFSVLGIMLGVATLILVTSLMNGIRQEMQSQLIGIEGHITITSAQMPVLLDGEPLSETLKAWKEVKHSMPKITGQVMATYKGRSTGAQVLAIQSNDYARKPLIAEALEQGDLEAVQRGEGIAIGQRFAYHLGVKVGDIITLISPQGRHTVAGFIPRIKQYKVVATLTFGMHMIDNSIVLMPFDDAQSYFHGALNGMEEGISALEVDLRDMNKAEEVALELQKALGADYRIFNWQRSNTGIFQALEIQRNVMVLILGLIVVVAAFNIVSSLIMLVKDKGQSIAVLRAIGFTQNMIMRIFVLNGIKIGLFGTSFGILLGVFAAKHIEDLKRGIETITGQEILVGEIYFLSSLPTETHLMDVVMIGLMSLSLCIFATIYPARRAGAIEPAEALRYE